MEEQYKRLEIIMSMLSVLLERKNLVFLTIKKNKEERLQDNMTSPFLSILQVKVVMQNF